MPVNSFCIRFIKLIFATSALLIVSSCGGGGGSSAPVAPTPTPAQLTSITLSQSTLTLDRWDDSATISAQAVDQNGNNVSGATITWSSPDADIAARQQRGCGGILSFELRGGDFAVRAFLQQLKYFSLAESLGGVESLVCHPASMTHAPMQIDALEKTGIGPDLIRLSVGIESADNLIADLLAALEAADSANDQLLPRQFALQK